MERKAQLDSFGAASLTGFALLLAFNQVVIKVTNDGLQPVFFAGVRSLGAFCCVLLWMWLRAIPIRSVPGTRLSGVLIGLAFGVEFLCLFVALDLTTVGRASVIFYSMPLWLALMSQVFLPNDRVTPVKAMGLCFAFAGVAWALLTRDQGVASLWGDLAALAGAITWALLALLVKASPLSQERPEVQLLWQLGVSAPILLVAAVFFGPLLREFGLIHLAGLVFQITIVASAGFLFWLWLMSIYPASAVASFSFLSPVLSVGLGWLLLGEEVGPPLIGALGLVAVGITLINRPVRSRKTSA